MPEPSSKSWWSSSSAYVSGATPELALAVGLGIGTVLGSLLSSYWTRRSSLAYRRPSYIPGQTPSSPSHLKDFGKHVKVFDPTKLASAYQLMISSVTPRPIALVSSRHPRTGIDNLSPFSYFGAMGHDPPMLAVGFCRSNTRMKDSLVNLKMSRQCVVNIISEWYLDAANHTCGNWPSEVDEFQESGLTKDERTQVVAAPRVQQAAVSYECQLEYLHPVATEQKGATTDIALLKVIRIHVDETVLDPTADPMKPVVDTVKLKPMSRLGGNIYATLGSTVNIPRPKVS